MIEPRQIRAARALLDWSRDDLARASGVSVPALGQIEGGNRAARTASLDKIKVALETAGVLFTDNSGVKLRSDELTTYEGIDGFEHFLDDVYLTLRDTDEPNVFVSGVERSKFVAGRSEERILQHRLRMSSIKKLNFRVISASEDETLTVKEPYVQYRVVDSGRFYALPIYGYGNKVAIIIWESTHKVIVINNRDVYRAFSIFFNLLWQRARPAEVEK